MTEKSLTQLQAEAQAMKLYTDLMASGGVSHGRMSQEVLFFLPRDFLDVYAEVFHKAFGGKDDGGIGQRGEAQAAQAELGKASGKGLQGLGGAKRKTYKKYWTIADEDMVALKDRMDKRLRSMAREMRDELTLHEMGIPDGGIGGKDKAGISCEGCGRRLQVGWKHCPNCGAVAHASEG